MLVPLEKNELRSKIQTPHFLYETSLALTVIDDYIIHVTDLKSGDRWTTTTIPIHVLLITAGCIGDEERIPFDQGPLIYTGLFDLEQIKLQQLGLFYDIFPDGRPRAQRISGDEFFYTVQHVSEMPGPNEVAEPPKWHTPLCVAPDNLGLRAAVSAKRKSDLQDKCYVAWCTACLTLLLCQVSGGGGHHLFAKDSARAVISTGSRSLR